MSEQDEKKKSIGNAIGNITKKYGKSAVREGGFRTVEFVPTNSFSLDKIMGGGMPKGRILEVYGQASSGKSTLAAFLVAQFQKAGGTAVWIDAEACWDDFYGQKVGVDVDKLIKSVPATGEEAFNTIDEFIRSCAVDIIVVDSVSNLVPAKELEKNIEDDNVALLARMMSKGMRLITHSLYDTKTIVIFINQIRDRIGFYMGNKTTTSGGHALKFYSSIRLEVRSIKKLKKKEEVVGNRLKITATKNKVGRPFGATEIDLYFEKGIDLIGEALDIATDEGIIAKSGITYTYVDQKLGAGRDVARNFLEDNPKIYSKIREQLLKIGKKDVGKTTTTNNKSD